MRTHLQPRWLSSSAVFLTGLALVSAQSPATGPTFDVVSIKRIPEGSVSSGRMSVRPDGGITLSGLSVGQLIVRAYAPDGPPPEIVGLPDWAMRDRFDVAATSTLTRASLADRAAMLRAMLADRFRLVARVEEREYPAFDLLLVRSDGKLGAGLMPISTDCAAKVAADRLAAEVAFYAGTTPPAQRPNPSASPPVCTLRMVGNRQGTGEILEGESTMAQLASWLRSASNRFVVNRTELPGSFRIRLEFSMASSLRGPDVVSESDKAPSVFAALREQLGLKLEPSRALQDTLVIERIERPTEN